MESDLASGLATFSSADTCREREEHGDNMSASTIATERGELRALGDSSASSVVSWNDAPPSQLKSSFNAMNKDSVEDGGGGAVVDPFDVFDTLGSSSGSGGASDHGNNSSNAIMMPPPPSLQPTSPTEATGMGSSLLSFSLSPLARSNVVDSLAEDDQSASMAETSSMIAVDDLLSFSPVSLPAPLPIPDFFSSAMESISLAVETDSAVNTTENADTTFIAVETQDQEEHQANEPLNLPHRVVQQAVMQDPSDSDRIESSLANTWAGEVTVPSDTGSGGDAGSTAVQLNPTTEARVDYQSADGAFSFESSTWSSQSLHGSSDQMIEAETTPVDDTCVSDQDNFFYPAASSNESGTRDSDVLDNDAAEQGAAMYPLGSGAAMESDSITTGYTESPKSNATRDDWAELGSSIESNPEPSEGVKPFSSATENILSVQNEESAALSRSRGLGPSSDKPDISEFVSELANAVTEKKTSDINVFTGGSAVPVADQDINLSGNDWSSVDGTELASVDADQTTSAGGAGGSDHSSFFNGISSPRATEGPGDRNDDFGESSAAVDDDAFGGFQGISSVGGNTSSFGFQSFESTQITDDDDDFGGFTQSNTTNTSNFQGIPNDDDDFGDFSGPSSSSTWGTTGGVSSSGTHGEDDDEFGGFNVQSASTASTWGNSAGSETSSIPFSSPTLPSTLDDLFADAFPHPLRSLSTEALLLKASSPHAPPLAHVTALCFDQTTIGALQKNFTSALQHFYEAVTSSEREPYQTTFDSEPLRLKYLKYVLTEKLSEASRHDGVFPHGSEQYRVFKSIIESGRESSMQDALSKLQDALFHSSVHEAMMRIAKQAALSAKAKIAEQAAQQQAHARSSLLATTRHFLSRGGGNQSSGSQASGGPNAKERDGGSMGVLTPTGASVHKLSRFSQDSEHSHSSGYGSAEDTGSELSVGEVSGSGSYNDGVDSMGSSGPGSSLSRTNSGSSGGLMKKFQSRLTSPFSVSRNRTRVVSLRQMGHSSEDVRTMEVNMDSINGGFDEVKWRCAVFVYEADGVARLAPSQIKLFSYPGNELLTGKNDRSMLTKFFKPGVVWSIDIGANSNSGVSLE